MVHSSARLRLSAAIAMAAAITLLTPNLAYAAADNDVDAIGAVLDTGAVATAPARSSSAPLIDVDGRDVVVDSETGPIATNADTLAADISATLDEEVSGDALIEALESLEVTELGGGAGSTTIDSSAGELTVAPGVEQSLTIGVPGSHVSTEYNGAATLASYDDGDVQYVLAASEGTSAAYAVIDSPDSPTEFRFDIGSGGGDVTMEMLDNGSVTVFDQQGDVVNGILPAWALDAAGNPVASSYRVEGSTLVQTINLTGDELFPVVADPSASCNFSTTLCTIRFNRSETQTIMFGGAAAAAVIQAGCSWVPIWQVKLACAAVAVSLLLGGG